MTTPIEALRELTLYINESEINSGIKAEWSAAIAQARAALALPAVECKIATQQQEPVAWKVDDQLFDRIDWAMSSAAVLECGIIPLYIHPSQDAKDAARYRDDLISCRGIVKTELNYYKRLAFMYWKHAVVENHEKEVQRLNDLLDRIDAAIKETP